MKKREVLLLFIFFVSGCIHDKKMYINGSFEYLEEEGGWFFGYFESSDHRPIKNVMLKINSVDSFTHIDTLRTLLDRYVYPGNQFYVTFIADGFNTASCSVKIPNAIQLTQFDGFLKLSDENGDTIDWYSLGNEPDCYKILIFKNEEKIYSKVITKRPFIIYPDIFTFAGEYIIYFVAINYSHLENSDPLSSIVGVYNLKKTYIVNN